MNLSSKEMLLCAGLIMLSSISAADSLDEYSSVKPLLMQELDNPNEKVQGEVVGKIADKISEATKSTSPVIATVTTIKQFKQEGCSRLNLHLQQGNVMSANGKLVDFGMDIGLNLCKNGDPPLETLTPF